jgi:glyoxylase-like metal-dependent hydrolase (beta-lactamase superfamily II)
LSIGFRAPEARSLLVTTVERIALPLPLLGAVNLWLLPGDPLTLVDAGPANGRSFAELEQQLSSHGFRVEDVEIVLLTHHHLDHSGLAAAIRERSGARVAAHRTTAAWGVGYHDRVAAEREFTLELIAAHGAPPEVVAATEPFFAYILENSADYEVDDVLADGDTIRAGGRTLRTVFRPGHSTSDTLFVDEDSGDAFVGDHLLAKITSGAELVPTELPGDERRRALLEYLSNLRKTEVMQLATCYGGHGPVVRDHRALIGERLAFHAERLELISGHVRDGVSTAFEIARRLWSDEVARTETVLAIWEVLGHLDILVNRGTVREHVDDLGHHHFRPKEAITLAAATS